MSALLAIIRVNMIMTLMVKSRLKMSPGPSSPTLSKLSSSQYQSLQRLWQFL